MHVIAAKAVSFREAMEFGFREYQRQIIENTKVLADEMMKRGFRLVSGGTDNHLMLIDLTNKDISGRDAADILEEAGVIVNKNLIPYDTKPPVETSGIRPGTPAITTRGMKESEMLMVADFFSRVIENPDDSGIRCRVKTQIKDLCDKFPIYQDLDLWS
jgi:glycine hydroxymethyltransferase